MTNNFIVKYHMDNKPNICSPSKKKSVKGTCYDNNDLIAIAQAYNNSIKTSKICLKKNKNMCIGKNLKQVTVKNKSGLDLYKQLSERLNPICPSDSCWTDLSFINTIKDDALRESILYFTFKPKMTKTNKTWFNTNNINEIMQQYQDLYKDTFVFLGAQPCDFAKIAKLNYLQLKQKSHIGIIFNTDKHTQRGQHWLAVFIDNVHKKVDYFDSLGNMPNKNIASFLKHFKTYTFKINRKEFQKGNIECGVYSCYYIIQRLNGLSFEQITERIITDKMMSDYRYFLFRK